jgi:hypothetical protein
MSLSVTQIVPRLPPPIDGVGDYALELAVQLRRFGIGCSAQYTVNGGPRLRDAGTSSPFVRLMWHDPLSDRGGSCCRSQHRRPPFLRLRLPGGSAPLWSVEALRRLKREPEHLALLVVLHELYSAAPVPRSSFWMATSFTTKVYFDELKRWRPDVSVAHMLSVPSNVGELETPTPLADRAPIAMLFGQEGARGQRWRRPLRSRSPRAWPHPIIAFASRESFVRLYPLATSAARAAVEGPR